MPSNLDTSRIRSSTPAQLRDHYKELLNEATVLEITQNLLGGVESGSIPPIKFVPWLGVTESAHRRVYNGASATVGYAGLEYHFETESAHVITQALKQKISTQVRKYAIKQLRLALCSVSWRQTWDGLGSTSGLLDIFRDLSVHEVRELCRALGRCGKGWDLEEKRKCITELFEGLNAEIFMQRTPKDRRLLGKYYRHLIPSCTEEIVQRVLTGDLKGRWERVRNEYLVRYHPDFMRRHQLRAVAGNAYHEINENVLGCLFSYYPSTTSPEKGFSSPMEYALTLLRTLGEIQTAEPDEEFVINKLARPLLCRAIKKKAPWSRTKEVVDLIVQYLEKHIHVRADISTTKGDILHLVARCWSRKPEMFEKQLRFLCAHAEYGLAENDSFVDWEDFLFGIQQCQRFKLLRLCLHGSAGLDIDVDTELKKVKGAMSDTLLYLLGPKEALDLFLRLRALRGNEDLVNSTSRSILDISATLGGEGGDPNLFHVSLLKRNGEERDAENLAVKMIDERKKRAALASLPEQRTFYARSVQYFAVASGSLGIYEHTLDWSKRFLRDPLVLRELQDRYLPIEIAKLLSGIPEPFDNTLDASTLRQRIEHANSILTSMFNTACAALKEPSFSDSDWHGTFGLFQSVVQERIDVTPKLKKFLMCSDDQLYKILWESTTQMLLAVEKQANEDQHIRLGANTTSGILGSMQQSSIQLKTTGMSTYAFLDNLAKTRDQLWRKLRLTTYPAVAKLPAVFPQGLPIQHLIAPWQVNMLHLPSCMPYLASRVEAALFPNAIEALQPVPEGHEIRKAIGTFVDSYQYTLKLYVPTTCDKQERKKRVEKIWNYAIGPLSQGRMNAEEAVRFWRNKNPENFEDWPPSSIANTRLDTWPEIPKIDNLTISKEWDPFSCGRPDFLSRELGDPSFIDLELAVFDRTPYNSTLRSTIDNLAIIDVPAHEVDATTIWNPSRDIGEGGVVAALLYLQSKFMAANRQLLQTPFPSQDDVRYPSLHLSDDFVQHEDLNVFSAIRDIRGHLDHVPPVLLQRFAQDMIKQLDDSKEHDSGASDDLYEPALLSIVRLGECDRPALAKELAIRTILERPDASSWHRQLLKPSFFRRMPASDAQSCFETFAKAILEAMKAKEDQRKEGVELTDRKQESQSSGEPYVKVTTVKFLAQLLQSIDFIGGDATYDTLSRLLELDLHIDVRVNVVKSLLAFLDGSPFRVTDVANVVYSLDLCDHWISNINERSPLSEEDWLQAENTMKLPELSNASLDSSPMLLALIDHYRKGSIDAGQLQVFADRTLLPILQRLGEVIARWVALFLRKYEAEFANLNIPPVPRDAVYWVRLLSANGQSVSFLPRNVLESYIEYIIFNITPPPAVRVLNKKLRDDPVLRLQPEVQTWLRLYDQGIDIVKQQEHFELLSLLDKPTKLDKDEGVSTDIVKQAFHRLFTAVLSADAPLYANLSTHLLLAKFENGNYLIKPWWPVIGKSIVSNMIAHVDSIRTSEWQRDPNRKPAVLPDTFPWRLLLLDYPWPSKSADEEEKERKCKVFAQQIAALIEEMSVALYHNYLAQIKHYLSLDPVSTPSEPWSSEKRIGKYTVLYQKRDRMHELSINNRALTALYLGNISGTQEGVPELLKVEVAAYLLELAELDNDEKGKESVDKKVLERLREMVQGWKESRSEDVRRFGWRFDEKFLGKR
jgi:hypothetical protein